MPLDSERIFGDLAVVAGLVNSELSAARLLIRDQPQLDADHAELVAATFAAGISQIAQLLRPMQQMSLDLEYQAATKEAA